MITDDARVLDPGTCQIETWHRGGPQGSENWALPGCNPTGKVELSVGGARLPDDPGRRSLVQAQIKTVLRAVEPGEYGVGLALGTQLHTSSGRERRLANTYAYVPITWSVASGRTQVHANLGFLNDRDAKSRDMTFGIGAEHDLTARVTLLGEVFGSRRTSAQVGLRYWLVPDRWQLDSTVGADFGNVRDGWWWSLGLRMLTPRIFN